MSLRLSGDIIELSFSCTLERNLMHEYALIRFSKISNIILDLPLTLILAQDIKQTNHFPLGGIALHETARNFKTALIKTPYAYRVNYLCAQVHVKAMGMMHTNPKWSFVSK